MTYYPSTYPAQFAFMLLSMFCWGSWANTMKLTPGWPFQLFYWDYVAGILLGSFAWGFALGGGPHPFLAALLQGDTHHLLLAILSGAVFNIANLLLVAAIDIAGMAVAFPVGIGLALVLGSVLNYILAPAGNPLYLFGGVALVAIAIVVDAMAYRRRELAQRAVTTRGIVLSLVSGLLMGLFYPILTRAMHGTGGYGPYAVAPYFALGVLLCAIPTNLWLMRSPLSGARVAPRDYFTGRSLWHVMGILGGAIWCSGAIANFVSSGGKFVGPAVSYAIGQGATMVSAVWGIFIWHEFASAPASAKRLIPLMFVLFLAGLTAIAFAPTM
ncbi:MAG TPA: GRP family sugar transporter [Acidobacteriaceae bacterium]